jgi:putative endonuclease
VRARGAAAEAAAAAFLEGRGLRILERNFNTRMGEIDLVAEHDGTLVFVEVRMRTSERFGGAAGSITAAKRRRIVAAARLYMARLQSEPACRFDAVLVDGEGAMRWIRGAFEA